MTKLSYDELVSRVSKYMKLWSNAMTVVEATNNLEHNKLNKDNLEAWRSHCDACARMVKK